MKGISSFVLFLGTLLTLVFTGASSSLAQDLIVRGGWIVHPESGKVIPNPDILVRNGSIISIGSTNHDGEIMTLQLEPDDHILPGLIDLHAHLKAEYKGITRDDTTTTPKMLLANGVTTIFTAGDGEPEKVLRFKENVADGKSIGPRILNSGPYFGRSNPVVGEINDC